MTALNLTTVRVAALFASHLQPSDSPNPDDVRLAVRDAIRRHGSRGCADLVAEEYGEHPDCAARRMAWARRVVSGEPRTLGADRTVRTCSTAAAGPPGPATEMAAAAVSRLSGWRGVAGPHPPAPGTAR